MIQHNQLTSPLFMTFEQHLATQALAHPSTQPRDIIKQCYQAAFGAEHLLTDPDRALRYLQQEYDHTPAADLPLCEAISPQVCRVNLAAWKQRGLPLEWLFRMFVATASITSDRDQAIWQFLSYLDKADSLIRENQLPITFSTEEWAETLDAYQAQDICAVHHSEAYRQAEHPAYRILRYEYVRLFPILEAVNDWFRSHSPSDSCVIAIDGRAASGKTIMADQLADILGADVIPMDDFFLPPELRTQERLQTAGGNVHYERFAEEVLPHLRTPSPFSYRRFDCSIMDYQGMRQVGASPIRIVEGSYSHHPFWGKYADILIFSHVDPDRQMERILHRNGPNMAKMFRTRWIPMEETYIQVYGIDTGSHVTIDSSQLF